MFTPTEQKQLKALRESAVGDPWDDDSRMRTPGTVLLGGGCAIGLSLNK